MKKRLKTFQYNFKWLQKGSFLTLVQEKYEFRSISKLPTVESTTNTEDMLCNVLILALIVNLSLKSRVRENRKHGSVGVTIALWSKCYGFYPTFFKTESLFQRLYLDLKGYAMIA